MASGPITPWQIDGEIMERVRDFILGGSKITAAGNCSHDIKRFLSLGRKTMTNLGSILKSRDLTLSTNVETNLTSMVSESMIWWENEKQDTRIQQKARIRGPTCFKMKALKLNPGQLYYTLSREGKNMRAVKL